MCREYKMAEKLFKEILEGIDLEEKNAFLRLR